MDKWPLHVEISEEGLTKYESLIKGAYKQIVSEINGATNFGVQNRKQILVQINGILADLGVNVDEFLQKELPDYYKQGSLDAVMQLKRIGADIPVSSGFNRVHKQAISSLVSDASSSFGDAIQGVSRSAKRLLSAGVKQQITQQIATGMAQGSPTKQIAKSIKGVLADEGLGSLVDKAGHTWQLDTYSEMLYRTKSVEARNLGMVNRMAENGYDLVQVSAHGAIDVCRNWEGKILSTTGATKEFQGEEVFTVDQATEDGLFHPNCRHAINAIAIDLAEETSAYTGEQDDQGKYQYAKGGGL